MSTVFQKAYDPVARGLRFQFIGALAVNVSPLDFVQILDRVVDSTKTKVKAVA